MLYASTNILPAGLFDLSIPRTRIRIWTEMNGAELDKALSHASKTVSGGVQVLMASHRQW
jgi:hypothetical protein